MATTATDGGADGAAASQLVSAGAGAGAGAGATGGGSGSGSGVEASNGTAPQTGAGGDDDAAAVAASSTEVPWEDLEVLLQGAPLCKFGRRGDPHYRHFELSADCTILSWYSSRKREADSRVVLREAHLLEGQQTDVFRRQSRADFADVSFSLMHSQKKGVWRSLDLVCKDKHEYAIWTRALRYLTTHTPPKALLEERRASVAGGGGGGAKGASGTAAALGGGAGTGEGERASGGAARTGHKITAHLKEKMADTNDVYAWGSNAWGQLGLGGEDEGARLAPSLVNALLGKGVRQVSCGDDHTAAVTEQGQVYVWGNGGCGRLGTGSAEHVMTPKLLVNAHNSSRPYSFKQVDCGDLHTLAVTDDGKAFAWGCGASGQLGLSSRDDAMLPRRISAFGATRLKSVCAGHGFSMAIDDAGKLYSWGCGDAGVLGHGDDTDRLTPTMIGALHSRRVEAVSCGEMHAAALTDTKEAYTWGWGGCGQLGHGDFTDRAAPTKVDSLVGLHVSSIACGAAHTAATVRGDDTVSWLYGWGAAGMGQLGHKSAAAAFGASAVAGARSPTSAGGDGASASSSASSASATATASGSSVATSNASAGGGSGSAAGGGGSGASGGAAGTGGGATAGSDSAGGAAGGGGATSAARRGSTSAPEARMACVALPRVVDCTRGVAMALVACGAHHTAALTESGVLYTYGDGRWGQLGVVPVPGSVASATSGASGSRPRSFTGLSSNAGSGGDAGTSSGSAARAGSSGGGAGSGDAKAAADEAQRMNTLTVGPQVASNLHNKTVRSVSCGGRHTCITVATAWIDDEETKTCMRCDRAFTRFWRRHHCRNCGGIFCAKCSSHRLPLLKLGFINPVRVCDSCYGHLQRRAGN